MLKGILLGICISTFIVSLIFTVSGLTGFLQPNMITGNIIGSSKVLSYSLLGMFTSFVCGILVVINLKRN